jgi:Putative restriction endonuclease
MTVVVVGEHPDVEAIIARRRLLGLDHHDEVWEGVYHMAPYAHSRHGKVEVRLTLALAPYAQAVGLDLVGPFNLGDGPEDFRVPDLGIRDPGPDAVYLPTCRVVVEVLSPEDETFAKFGFYAAHGVDEVLVADPDTRTVRCWELTRGEYQPVGASTVLDLVCADLAASLDWP